MVTETVHISQIRGGDTILHNGVVMTVSYNNIKYSEFMGVTVFGDSYCSGYKSVIRICFPKAK
jgi:hypothetical protein